MDVSKIEESSVFQSVATNEDEILQAVRRVLFEVAGVDGVSLDTVLRDQIPNSLTFVQLLLALENTFSIKFDYSHFDYDSTVASLVSYIQQTPMGEAPPTQDSGDGHAMALALNAIQTAYILGADEDIELGGQATFIYSEVLFKTSAHQLVDAANFVINRHHIGGCFVDVDQGLLILNKDQSKQLVFHSSKPISELRDKLKQQAKLSNEKAPMIYGYAIQESKGVSRLLIYFNMIVMDAGSLYVFFNELQKHIAKKELPPVLSYEQAISEINSACSDHQRQRAVEYWQTKCKELPEKPDFGTEILGTTAWSTERLQFTLGTDEKRVLERIAHDYKVSISSLLLSVNAAVVARWLNVSGLTVNVTISDRGLIKTSNNVLGDFTTSMLIGVDIATAESLAELAKNVDQNISEGLTHRAISGVEVLKFMRSGQDQTSATAPIVFTSYVGGADTTKTNLQIDYIYTQTAQVCLDMQVMPKQDDLSISWDYVPEYFPHIREMFGCLKNTLASLISGSEILPVKDPNAERLVRQYNQTKTLESDETLLSLIKIAVQRFSNQVALQSRAHGITLSYSELWNAAEKVAAYLLTSGCTPRSNVIIEYSRHPNDIINIIGVLRAGCAYVPVDSRMPEKRKEHIATVSSSFCALNWQTFENLPETRLKCEPNVSRDSLAYIIFTSGTTGTPKGVEITHRACVNTIKDINHRYSLSEHDCIIGVSALGFDLSVYDIFGTLSVGASLAMISDERDADEILEVLERDQVTLWNSAPALMELVLLRNDTAKKFPHVRYVMLSGDRIPSDQPKRIHEAFPNAKMESLGGATEASIWSIRFPLDVDSLVNRVPYGYPLSNQEIYVLGVDGISCPIGVEGEIHIGGIGLAQGYIGEPERTSAAFISHPTLGRLYRTGDMGVFNNEGFVEFRGRKDRQVKIAGHRIELGEIESVISQSGLCESCIATVVPMQERNLLVVLYIPASADASVDNLRYVLKENVPDYMIPSHILKVERIPTTTNGKLDQREIQRLISGELNSSLNGNTAQEVNSAILNRVEEIWTEILGLAPSGTSETFFNRGGDSLQFQRMLRKIHEIFGVRLKFRDVIQLPTAEAVATLIDNSLATTSDSVRALPIKTSEKEPIVAQDDPFAAFPLTDMQMAYYVGRSSGFELGGVTEHYYIESVSSADISRLNTALNALIERHAMLRVVFTSDAQQKILPEVPFYHIEVSNFRNATEEELHAAILQKREQLSHQVFELSQWPLFHLSAFALPNGKHRLFFSVDMIIGDGASQRIFLNDLEKLYRGEPLEEIKGNYRDYVIRLTAANQTQDHEFDTTIAKIVDEFPAGNTLPSRYLDSASKPQVQRLRFQFNKEEYEQLKNAARGKDISVSALLLALYANSLSLWSGSNKVGVNVTTYNRNADFGDVSGVFGDFTGVILLGFDNPALSQLDIVAKETQSRLIEHLTLGYSGVRVISEIANSRGMWGKAVAPFVFTSLLFADETTSDHIPNDNVDEAAFGSTEYAISQTPQVLIDNQLLELDGELNIAWDYVEQVLDVQMMKHIFDHYIETIKGIITGRWESAPIPASRVCYLKQLLYADGGKESQRTATVSPISEKEEYSPFTDQIIQIINHDLKRSSSRSIEPETNLFEAGYDSLRFVQMIQKIQDATGSRIPLAQALSKPTPATIAALCDIDTERKMLDSLVLLRKGTTGPTVIMVHGGFGTIDIYRDIAMALPENFEVWGAHFQFFERNYPYDLSIEEIAEKYVAELQVITSQPVVIMGWSLGGTIAAAMAKQLGDGCLATVLLDSLAPGIVADVGNFDIEHDRNLLYPFFERSILDQATTLADLWQIIYDALASSGNPHAESNLVHSIAESISYDLVEDLGISGNQVTLAKFASLRTLVAARNKFKPNTKMTDRALFILPDDGEASNYKQWSQKLISDLQVIEIYGNHYSFILGRDAQSTAEIIVSYLEEIGKVR